MPTITLSRPAQGQAVTVLATGKNAKLALEFSTDDVSLSRDADSLIFTFEDGAAIRIDDFYTSYHAANIPEFEVDGKLVSGTEFFSALGPDLIPAAGPATVARTARSSDHGAVSDLASGVDHLDGADITVEGSAFQTGSLLFDSSAASLAGAAGSGAAGPGAAAETPFFPAGPFVRAVLYSPGATGDAVTANVFFGANGAAPAAIATGDADFDGTNAAAPYAVSVSLPAGWSSSWVDVSFNSLSGRLEFRLTADGVAEMQRLGLTGESLVDFIHITVTDRASGDSFEYNVELVATDNQNFDSAAHDSRYGGQHLDNIGEFHQGQNNGGAYSVVSSAQNDEIIINDTVIGGSSIHASGSADPDQMADDYNTINLAAGVVNTTVGSTTHITSADGTLDVSGGVTAQGSGAENVIDMGKGSVHVQSASSDGVSAAHGVFAVDGGKNTISGGSVNIAADEQGLQAQSGSVNSVTAIDGDITINALWNGVGTSDNSTTNLSATNGSVSIKTDCWGISSGGNSSTNVDVTNGDLEIDAIGRGVHAYGGTADDGSVNGYSTNTVSVTNGNVNIKGGWEGLLAHYGGTNNIDVAGGSIYIDAAGAGVYSVEESANNLTVTDGSLHITAAGTGLRAEGNSANTVDVGGDVTITGASFGVLAAGSGSNSITTESGDVTVTGNGSGDGYGDGYGMSADSSGSNSITTESGEVTVTGSGSGDGDGFGYGMSAIDDGSNSITTESGSVTVSGYGQGRRDDMFVDGMKAESSGSNKIETVGGDVTVRGQLDDYDYGFATGMHADSSGSNEIKTADGKVIVEGSSSGYSLGMYAANAAASNAITTKGGDVTVTGSSSGGSFLNHLLNGGGAGYGMFGFFYGSNTIKTESGNVSITGSGDVNGWGMSGSNSITTESGNVTVTGSGDVNGWGMSGSNSITTESGNVTVTGTGGYSGITGYGYGMSAYDSGSNKIKTADGNVTVTGTGADEGCGMSVDNGGSNSITTESGNVTVTSSADPGVAYGMSATRGGVNTIESTSGSPLTVTITASASAAEKAIAMWADGGGSVNRIAGHSVAGGKGDSITLTANNGQGIAMQAENGGKNIITTGAGDDSVTINGDVKGDANGNKIDLGGGDNTLTLNGKVEQGSLNVSVDNGGTYTLVLQADTPADFVEHYGAWLTDIVNGNLIDGLSEVVFYGLDPNNLPSETSFENLLNTLNSAGVDYSFQPPESAPQGDSPSPFSFAMPAETGAEHHTQDAQHAAGHDGMQDSPLAAHDGPALMTDHMTGDSPETIFSAQPGNTAHAEVPGADALGAGALGADALAPDDAAQMNFAEGEDADGQAQPLFAFLSDPADMSPGTPADMLTDLPDLPDLFEEGDDALHNGYLGNEGADGSDFAELYTPVTLTYGDESLDSLFAAADGQDTEQDGTGLFGETGLHDMGLTNMNAALDQSHLAGPAAPDASGAPAGPAVAAAESAAAATSEISSIPSVADSCQEATDHAAREMTNC